MDEVKFKRKIAYKGTSPGITIPQELLEYLEVKIGDELNLVGKKGKYGKFIAIFE